MLVCSIKWIYVAELINNFHTLQSLVGAQLSKYNNSTTGMDGEFEHTTSDLNQSVN